MNAGLRGMQRRLLVHSVTVTGVKGQDAFAQPTNGTQTPGVPCFIIQNPRRRITDSAQQQIVLSHEVQFAGAVNVEVNCTLSAGVDKKGTTLLTSAKVIQVDPISDPKEGIIAKVAYCQPL